jgi:hypothetical protein
MWLTAQRHIKLLTEFAPSQHPATINIELLTEFAPPQHPATINIELLTEFRPQNSECLQPTPSATPGATARATPLPLQPTKQTVPSLIRSTTTTAKEPEGDRPSK